MALVEPEHPSRKCRPARACCVGGLDRVVGHYGFQLAKPDGGAFAHNDDLFSVVADGQKLYATKADVEADQ
jgi:hypothetical protein